MKKIIMLALMLLAAWMARRAIRSGQGRRAASALRQNSEVMAALWLVLGMTAQLNVPGSAKSRATEDRLNALIPVVFPNTGGTINGSVAVTGNHNVSGQLNVGGASGAASVAVNGNGHFTSGLQADGGFSTGSGVSAGSGTFGGGGGSATVSVGGNVHASSTGQFDGGVVTGNVNSTGGSTNEYSGGIHSGGSVQADAWLYGTYLQINGQRIAPGQGNPAGYPYVGGTIANVDNALNAIVNGLQAAGMFS